MYRGVDDLRSGYDPDDDDRVRVAHERRRRWSGQAEPPALEAPRPLSTDEVVCRRCHLVVKAPRHPAGLPLLACDDCRWD